MASVIVNAINFQLLWLCSVIFADERALVCLLVFFLIHVTLPSAKIKELRYVIFFTVAGLLIESSLASIGLIAFTGQKALYTGDYFNIVVAPLWLIALWSAFAACIDHSLKAVFSRPILLWALTAIAIPSSYYLGSSLSHSQILVSPAAFVLAELALWFIVLFVFIRFVKHQHI